MFSGNGYRGMEKRKLVIIVHFLASLLALELSSGRSPLGRAHLKVSSVKADLEGRLELNINAVLDAFFFNVGTACAGQWGHWKLLCLQFSESLGLMPAGSIQRDVWVPEQSLSLPSYHFHSRLWFQEDLPAGGWVPAPGASGWRLPFRVAGDHWWLPCLRTLQEALC